MTGGLLDIADVTVEVEPSVADHVVVALDGPADDYPPDPAWVAAAVRGAEQTSSELAGRRPACQGWSVTIRQILGTVSDTRPIAVQCAGGLAVWRAVANGGPEPAVHWGRDLHLAYPPVAAE